MFKLDQDSLPVVLLSSKHFVFGNEQDFSFLCHLFVMAEEAKSQRHTVNVNKRNSCR